MTNCFPWLFVAYGQNRSNAKSRLRTILWMMIFVLILSLIPPFSQQIAVAQTTPNQETIFLPILSTEPNPVESNPVESSTAEPNPVESSTAEPNPVPDGCIYSTGAAVKPLDGEGAWAIILNFNHASSTTETIACLAVVTSMEPEKIVEYNDDFRCAIVNNIGGIEVGHGRAPFDGNFKIECPAYIHESAKDVKYDKFYVHAKARFPEAAATYMLIEHSDVRFGVTYEQVENSDKWNVTFASRYGDSEFENSRIIERMPKNRFGLQSTIVGGEGTHHVNRSALAARTPVDKFGFDFEEPIQIGGGEPGWVLYQLVIDPPEPEVGCC